MRFAVPTPPVMKRAEPKIGNVYKCKGGGKTRYWIIVGMDDRTVNLLGINPEGKVTSTVNYGRHVLGGSHLFQREMVGRCEGIESLQFDITWNE